MFFFRFVPTACSGIRQTFGKFNGLCEPGLNFYWPFIGTISLVSNRLWQHSVSFEVKTKDNVFSRIWLAVQYRVKSEDSVIAQFSLNDPISQIESYIENVVRAKVPKLKLDELFEAQDDISKEVNEKLHHKMIQHGYTIETTLVTAIDPDKDVKTAMNKINSSERLKEAAKNEAESNYIMEVRAAEAARDRKRLQGEGTSQQRLAILQGYEKSMSNLNDFGLTP